jgi:plastocyanin
VEIVVDSYSFSPDYIKVKAGMPVELMLRSVTSLIPHNFTIDDPASGLDVDVDVPSGEDVTVTFTPEKTGKFEFYCGKKGIFGAHKKKGMVGTIEVE